MRSPLESFPNHIHCVGKDSETRSAPVSPSLKALSSAFSLHLALGFSAILRLTVLQPAGWDVMSHPELPRLGKICKKKRQRMSWPGHTVNWGREPATRAIAVVADLPAQSIHLWLTICLGSCKHQQNTMFFPSSAILSLFLPLMSVLATNWESSISEKNRSNCSLSFAGIAWPGSDTHTLARRAAQGYFNR